MPTLILRSLRLLAIRVTIAVALVGMVVSVHGETLAQRQALYDFYGATNKSSTGGWSSSCSTGGWRTMGGGPPSTFCNGTSGTYSTYKGVTCNAPNGNITRLHLGGCNLNGTLTASLSALTELQSIYLSENQLSGTLPPQWSVFNVLQSLSLNSNQLTGTLPPQWSTMTMLGWLTLGSNQLSGTLPPQWSAMSSMLYLHLYSNQLTGTLPPQWSSMTKMLYLHLHSNQLTGTLPPQWSNMSLVQELYLHSNQLSGTLPSQWSAMINLQGLQLFSNQLTGTVPPQWPEGMRNIRRFSSCNVTCSGVVGVNAACRERGPYSCLAMQLWYNCLDISSTALPPINSSNLWNWGNSTNMYFGPQRTDFLHYSF